MTKVPSMTGDVVVTRSYSANIARCAHCGELVQLGQDLDNDQVRLAHRGPRCEEWERGGVAYVARAAGADPERAVELMVDQRRLLLTRGDADVLLAALDVYRGSLPESERRASQARGLASMLEAATAGADHKP